jgi:hypothetical protein
MERVNQAWIAERKQRGEVWARELEQLRTSGPSAAKPESKPRETTTSLWSELELLSRAMEGRKGR